MAPLKARADRLPRCPTRASDNTAQPAKPTAKGPKITEPPRISTATPDHCEPPGTIPAARLTASRTLTGLQQLPDAARPERSRQACPRRLRRDGCCHESCLRTAATTAAIITNTWKTRLHPRHGESTNPGQQPSQYGVLTNEFSTFELAAHGKCLAVMKCACRLGALGRRFSLCCERAQIMRFSAGDAVPESFSAAVGSTGAVDGLWSRKCCVAESARIED
jgi:hypothetical protein